MPKSYPTPDQRETERDTRPRKTVGVYGRPVRTVPTRAILLALVAILAIVLVAMLYRLVRGDQLSGSATASSPTSIGSHQSSLHGITASG